jgi:hypothetical protein
LFDGIIDRPDLKLEKVKAMLAQNIEIPEVPIPLRVIVAHKKRVAALRRVKRKKVLDSKARLAPVAKKRLPS